MTVNEWAKDFKSFVNELQMPRDDYKGIMEYIDDALALLKEQNGKWVWKSGDRYTCSVCGMETSVDEEMEEPLYAYCPFCGAKMEWGGRNGGA